MKPGVLKGSGGIVICLKYGVKYLIVLISSFFNLVSILFLFIFSVQGGSKFLLFYTSLFFQFFSQILLHTKPWLFPETRSIIPLFFFSRGRSFFIFLLLIFGLHSCYYQILLTLFISLSLICLSRHFLVFESKFIRRSFL